MAKVFIEESNLTAIGEAIRSKTGKTDLLSPASMASEITSITTGGGSGEDVEVVLTGECNYACANSGWAAVFDKVRTENISNADNMFAYNTAENIPFDINLSPSCTYLRYTFQGMSNLKNAPLIKGNLTGYGSHICFLFSDCNDLREIPYDYFNNFGGETFWTNAQTNSSGYRQSMFSYCYSLRKLPDIRKLRNAQATASRNLYYNLCNNCYTLDEITNLPVIRNNLTSNFFTATFYSCYRLKNITFETNEDGSPIVVTWKNQTIDLSGYVGCANMAGNCTIYNSGITADKQVTDDATYQALKNDPDWFSTSKYYSRYDHDSAVNTINSLPDVSAGSGNTLKLLGGYGRDTDGGAINTLTEEEIAVATAKGWTISFV